MYERDRHTDGHTPHDGIDRAAKMMRPPGLPPNVTSASCDLVIVSLLLVPICSEFGSFSKYRVHKFGNG